MHSFQITLRRAEAAPWPVIVEHSAGDSLAPVRAEGELSVDPGALREADHEAEAYGQLLGAALFKDAVRDAFIRALAAAADQPMRVLLFVEDQALRALRWERLCAPIDGTWALLATEQRTPFSRYLPSLADRRFPPVSRHDLHALVVAASPPGLSAFGLDPFDDRAAVERVQTALGLIPASVLAAFTGAVGPPTLDAICAQITAQPVSVLHLICHGRTTDEGETVIFLAHADDPQKVDPVTATRLLERLGSLQGARGLPQFTFLATCESASPAADGALGGLAQRLVLDLGMPAVVAMADKVSVETATGLAGALYARLVEHGEVDRALAEASAGLAERGDITVPVLFSRLGARPLFSDSLDRPLRPEELAAGLARLETLLDERAPVLREEFTAAAAVIRRTLATAPEALSPEARQERRAALEAVDAIALEATELAFQALALRREPPVYDSSCPFPGLRAFRGELSRFFFGREALVARLKERLAAHPFLAVLGASGTGKSSVVLAGLVPALQRAEPSLRVASFTPGDTPLVALARALEQANITPSSPAAPSLIIVDQFEELFTLATNRAEREAFLEQLLALPGQHRLVLTMRADFWGEVAPFAALRDAMQAHQELVPAMTPEQLRRAMELQAGAVGLRFEGDLTTTILDDVRGEPGAMPLLQHALQELWLRRRGRWLRAAEYRAIGGIHQAIAHTADALFDRSTPEERERLRDIFLRLTRVDAAPGEERRDTRQRVPVSDLVPAGATADPVRELLRRLADSRLVVSSVSASGVEQVEVAHEALIRSWPRLRAWLEEDRAGLLLRAAISQGASEWQREQLDEDFLFRGSRLDDALALSRLPRFAPNAQERAFLDAAVALRDREEQEREAVRQRELDQARALAQEQKQRADEAAAAARTLRQRAVVLGVVAVIALGAMLAAVAGGWAAAVQQGRAEAARDEAVAARDEAETQRATAVAAESEAVAQRAEAEAQRAEAETQRAAAEANLRSAIQRRYLAATQAGLSAGNLDVALSAALVAARLDPSDSEAQRLLGLVSDAPATRLLMEGEAPFSAVAISPDGTVALAGDIFGTVALWDLETGEQIRAFSDPDRASPVTGVVFADEGDTLIAGWFDGQIVRFGLSSVTPFAPADAGTLFDLAISPDGATLVSAHASGVLLLWDVATGQELPGRLEGHTDEVNGVAISPDGTSVLSASSDDTVRLWDLASRTETLVFGLDPDPSDDLEIDGHVGDVLSVAFNSDGTLAASGSADQRIAIWDVAGLDPEPLFFLEGHAADVNDLEFDTYDDRLVSCSFDGTMRLWDLDSRQEVTRFLGHSSLVQGLAVSPTNFELLSASGDFTLRLWEIATASQLERYDPESDDLSRVAVSPDGALALATSFGGDVQRFSLNNTDLLPPFADHGNVPAIGLAISPDGTLAASGDDDGTILLWNPADGELLESLSGHTDAVNSLAFSADGTLLASGSTDGSVRVWSVAEGREVDRFPLEDIEVEALAFTPDQQELWFGTVGVGLYRWSLADGSSAVFEGHDEAIMAVAASPDGSLIATGSLDQRILLWDRATGAVVGELRGHLGGVLSLAFSPDGTRLASGSFDTSVRVWDVRTESEIRRLLGHSDAVYGVVFHPNGVELLSVSNDNSLRHWLLRTPEELVQLISEERYVEPPSPEEQEQLEAQLGLDLFDE